MSGEEETGLDQGVEVPVYPYPSFSRRLPFRRVYPSNGRPLQPSFGTYLYLGLGPLNDPLGCHLPLQRTPPGLLLFRHFVFKIDSFECDLPLKWTLKRTVPGTPLCLTLPPQRAR